MILKKYWFSDIEILEIYGQKYVQEESQYKQKQNTKDQNSSKPNNTISMLTS